MMKLSFIVLLACLALAKTEPKIPQRGLVHQIQRGVAGPNPYIFLTVPRGRSQSLVQGFEVIENEAEDDDDEEEDNDRHKHATNDINDDDDEDDNNDDDDDDNQQDDDEEDEDVLPKHGAENNDDDDEEEILDVMNMNMKMKKPNLQIKSGKPTQMMVSREHAGAIMVPDQIIEIEGQSVIDEKTGKPALLLPRAILDSIPDGSVVALMERSVEPTAEERANRVMVRRRRKGARRNVKRRRGGSNNKRRRVNKRGGNKNKRRRVNKRGGNKNKRRRGGNRGGNKRKNNRRRVVLQG